MHDDNSSDVKHVGDARSNVPARNLVELVSNMVGIALLVILVADGFPKSRFMRFVVSSQLC